MVLVVRRFNWRNIINYLATSCVALCLLLLAACSRIEIIESPRTAVVSDTEEPKDPKIVWTSRGLNAPFDYLGVVKTRSWSYEGALDRIVEGGKQLKADACIDVHYEKVGFLSTMQAFAIKYK